MTRSINAGDFVKVYFDGRPPIEGYVQSVPCDVGDMWYIKVLKMNGRNSILAINPSSSKLLYIEQSER